MARMPITLSRTGRPVVRVSMSQYGETLGAWLHVGSAQSVHAFEPRVQATERLLDRKPHPVRHPGRRGRASAGER